MSVQSHHNYNGLQICLSVFPSIPPNKSVKSNAALWRRASVIGVAFSFASSPHRNFVLCRSHENGKEGYLDLCHTKHTKWKTRNFDFKKLSKRKWGWLPTYEMDITQSLSFSVFPQTLEAKKNPQEIEWRFTKFCQVHPDASKSKKALKIIPDHVLVMNWGSRSSP